MNFFQKTLYKLKILFTDPKKFLKIIRDIYRVHFFPVPETETGKRFSTDIEVVTLQKYATAAKVGVVEIGVLDGGTTKEIAKNCHVPIYGIDPIIPDSMNKKLIGNEQKILQNMKNYPKFFFFKDFSYNLAKNWTKPFDFIFIDGDHNYEAVKQDFEDWLPLLTPFGIVAMHDSAAVTSGEADFAGWSGPIRLVGELMSDPRVEYVETRDSLTVFRKKG
jgi:predicted O-methyltransferase YrrM